MSTKTDIAPSRNVEIKARIDSKEDYTRKINIAKDLTSQEGELLQQRDVFFHSKEGRLKLRYFKNSSNAELISYNRPDTEGPKLSEFHKFNTSDPETLEKILTSTNGIRGVLEKDRLLYVYKNTRIHLDNVKNLGYFLEFEVVLKPEESIEEGQAFANEMMKRFEISNEHLIKGAYLDQLISE